MGCNSDAGWTFYYVGSKSTFHNELYDGEMTVVPPWNYAPGTWVELTFSGLSYKIADGTPIDLSNVTYQGQAPFSVDDGAYRTASYIVQMSGDTPVTISSGSFGWPSSCASGNSSPNLFWSDSEDYLMFDGFGNSPLPTQIIHLTYATTPSNRARTTIGVGEQVMLYLSPGCPCANPTWSLSGPGSLTTAGSGMLLTAYDQTSQPTVTATCCGKSYSVPFTVVEPANETAIIYSNDTFTAGTQGVGMWLSITVAPTTVSFYNIQAEELGEPATSITGYFTNHPPPYHDPGVGWVKINQANKWADHASFGGFSAPWTNGGFQYVIPVQWRVPAWNTHIGTLPDRVQACSISDTNGTSTVSKLLQSATRIP